MSAEGWHIVGQLIGWLFMIFGIIAAVVLWLCRTSEAAPSGAVAQPAPLPVPVEPHKVSTTTMTITTTRWAVPAGYVLAGVPLAEPQASPVPEQRRSGDGTHSGEIQSEPVLHTS